MLFDQFNNSGGGRDDNEDPYDKFDQMLENIANVGDLSAVPREKPMFSLGRIDYEPKGLLHMAICNGIVIMAMQNGHIIRLSLNATQELEDIEFARKKDDQIYKVFFGSKRQQPYHFNGKQRKLVSSFQLAKAACFNQDEGNSNRISRLGYAKRRHFDYG